jgi:hypothetical protein
MLTPVLRIPRKARGVFVRFVMGKPYAGEDWEHGPGEPGPVGKKKEEDTTAPAEKFTKAFQAYLDALPKEERQPASQQNAGEQQVTST